MSEQQGTGDTISANFSKVNNSGQMPVGKDISLVQNIGSNQPEQSDEAATLKQEISALKARVEKEAPPEKKAEAIKRVAELEEAIFAEEPDEDRMEYVKRWFSKNLPTLTGAVTSVIINPFVGGLVKTAGEMASDELRARMGG